MVFCIFANRNIVEMQTSLIKSLSKNYFWDIDISRLDDFKNRRIIIERVLSIGDFDDLRRIIQYFGVEVIKQEIILAGQLDKKTLNWVSQYFNIPITDFKCYIKIQSNLAHWNF